MAFLLQLFKGFFPARMISFFCLRGCSKKKYKGIYREVRFLPVKAFSPKTLQMGKKLSKVVVGGEWRSHSPSREKVSESSRYIFLKVGASLEKPFGTDGIKTRRHIGKGG